MSLETNLLGVEEVARMIGVEVSTVWRWCREGRLPCLKAGKHWRVRREAMDGFLRRSERPTTLVEQLQSYLRPSDNVLAVAQSLELLHRLDAAFFRAGEERGGVMVKFYGGESASEEELREQLVRGGLEVQRLEREGRFFMRSESRPGERGRDLQGVFEELGAEQVVWVSFNWSVHTDLESALQGQRELYRLASSDRLVVKTALLDSATDEWPSEILRRAQDLHSGTIWAAESGLPLSRRMPMPPA